MRTRSATLETRGRNQAPSHRVGNSRGVRLGKVERGTFCSTEELLFLDCNTYDAVPFGCRVGPLAPAKGSTDTP